MYTVISYTLLLEPWIRLQSQRTQRRHSAHKNFAKDMKFLDKFFDKLLVHDRWSRKSFASHRWPQRRLAWCLMRKDFCLQMANKNKTKCSRILSLDNVGVSNHKVCCKNLRLGFRLPSIATDPDKLTLAPHCMMGSAVAPQLVVEHTRNAKYLRESPQWTSLTCPATDSSRAASILSKCSHQVKMQQLMMPSYNNIPDIEHRRIDNIQRSACLCLPLQSSSSVENKGDQIPRAHLIFFNQACTWKSGQWHGKRGPSCLRSVPKRNTMVKATKKSSPTLTWSHRASWDHCNRIWSNSAGLVWN